MFFSRRGRTYVYRRRIYNGASGQHPCVLLLLFILASIFFIGIPWYVFSCEQELFEMTTAFSEAEDVLVSIPSDKNPNPSHTGELVHIQSDNIQPGSVVMDPDFQLSNPKALKMKRIPEFCQWIEHYTEEKRRINENEEEVIRTYWYTKGWVSSPIPSLLFDQPFKHHNPLRNPFPNRYWNVDSAGFGDYTLDFDVINSITSFKTKVWDGDNLNHFSNSPALSEGFKYIGDGYFYSAYESSGMSTIMNAAGQFLEGSLLDIQLIDFLPQCTPGDIRVHYATVEPTSATVIGLQKDSIGSIGGWVSSRGYIVALMREGYFGGIELLDVTLQEYLHWTVWVARALLIVWSCIILVCLTPGQTVLFYLMYSAAYALCTLGMMWFLINPELLSFSTILSIVFLAVTITLLRDWFTFLTSNNIPPPAQSQNTSSEEYFKKKPATY